MKAEEIREAKCTYGSSTAEQALVHEARFHGKMLREIAAQIAEGQVSLRDRLAMAVLQGMLSSASAKWFCREEREMYARECYLMADVMLAARDTASPVPVPETPQFGETGLGMNPETGCISNEELAKRDSLAALLATPVSDPETFTRCEWCGNEVPRPSHLPVGETTICSDCIPF